ncbi:MULTISPECIES: hypothetical protein [unclassified Pseudofrankia]|uniref:hypothetical protein n=1 Tax=unclassified Pseudofrankia TaxID=2994372 RepID=UPI0008D9094E|nr:MULTISPECIES: hypothetical protein [unclassified Pseudofrankia]MDT3440704.1 hypothetical protein [Pseudofrankia sp. BMG5.37]OHV58910.1 hypothetical protein BCD48_05705 [Pseudofrankia sp. BMG5.36]
MSPAASADFGNTGNRVTAGSGPVIYPARRAVEHVVTLPGVRPLRLFPVLWPLHQVETTARVCDEQAYEIIDHFVVRALAEGRIERLADVAWFLALPESLVQRCVEFLRIIDHVHVDGDRLTLTGLGRRSWEKDIRYEWKESRLLLLFEQRTSWALPRAYYHGNVTVLPTPEVPPERLRGGSRFLSFFDATPFNPAAFQQLAAHPDRAAFNLPGLLTDLRITAVGNAFLPVYLVETERHGVLVYTALAEEPDDLFGKVIAQVHRVGDLIEAEGVGDPARIWSEWAERSPVGPAVPTRQGDGQWRITLPAKCFGPVSPQLSLSRVGSYELREHHFAQLWCDDAGVRRQAIRERALAITRTPDVGTFDDLRQRFIPIARALAVPAPTVADLRDFAERAGRTRDLDRLDALVDHPSPKPRPTGRQRGATRQ